MCFYSDFFPNCAKSKTAENRAVLNALTGLQFQLRVSASVLPRDINNQEMSSIPYSQCHIPFSKYPASNTYFSVGRNYSLIPKSAIS